MAENDQKKIMMIAIFVAAIIIVAIILLPSPAERAIVRAKDLDSSQWEERATSSDITFQFRKDNPIGNNTPGAFVDIYDEGDNLHLNAHLFLFNSNDEARIALEESSDSNGFNSTSTIDFADAAILGKYPTTNVSVLGYTIVFQAIELFFVKGNALAVLYLNRAWVIGVQTSPTTEMIDLIMCLGTVQLDKLVTTGITQ
jgi:hypothetical protein